MANSLAILIHATSNASSGLIPQWLNVQADDPWALSKVFGVAAVVLVPATGGRLGYRGKVVAESAPVVTQRVSVPST